MDNMEAVIKVLEMSRDRTPEDKESRAELQLAIDLLKQHDIKAAMAAIQIVAASASCDVAFLEFVTRRARLMRPDAIALCNFQDVAGIPQ